MILSIDKEIKMLYNIYCKAFFILHWWGDYEKFI